MHDRSLLALCLVATLLGCPAVEEETCPPLDDLSSGEVSATVDGASWTADDGSWFWAGTNLQVVTGTHDGYHLSMVARAAVDGTLARDAVNEGVFPIEIPLSTGLEGGWALMYPASGASFASERAAGGTWWITAVDGGELQGCFAAELGDGETTLAVDDAILRLPQTLD